MHHGGACIIEMREALHRCCVCIQSAGNCARRGVAHGSSLFHWLFRKVHPLLWVYSCGILMYEHVGEQVHIVHAVDGSHAPPILTILHASSHDKRDRVKE